MCRGTALIHDSLNQPSGGREFESTRSITNEQKLYDIRISRQIILVFYYVPLKVYTQFREKILKRINHFRGEVKSETAFTENLTKLFLTNTKS